MTRTHQLETTLRTLKLSGMLDTLDVRVGQAPNGHNKNRRTANTTMARSNRNRLEPTTGTTCGRVSLTFPSPGPAS
jgi:hypothetical protein